MSAYVDENELRSMLTMQGTAFADYDIDRAILVTNPAINALCNRSFDKQTPVGETETRLYRPQSGTKCHIDDLIELAGLESAQFGGTDFSHEWDLDAQIVLGPQNAAADGLPWTYIELNPWQAPQGFPYWVPNSMRVTGRWGWLSVPPDVIGAAYLLASRLIKRWRQAPLALVTVGTDVGSAIRVGRDDPDVTGLLSNYTREQIV
jgi:hypothetical protein